MKLDSMLPFRLGSARRANLVTVVILLTFILTIITSKVALTEQHNLQSGFDEEIILEPNHDYGKTYVDHSTHDSLNNINNFGISTDQRQLPVQNFDHNDPFAVTFEDYLKDTANKSQTQLVTEDANDSSFSSSLSAIPDTAGLIIEDEENLVRPKESRIIDYIFPPSKQEASNQSHHPKHTVEGEKLDNNSTSSSTSDPNPIELLNEIRLLFAWKQLPTNKCSQICGKGFRVNHLSCVDLKYDVRVENELCHKSKLPKPSATSDEPCNEIDCPPQWTSVEFQECNPATVQDGVCRPNLYKRVQCTMINKSGISVYLDDSKCNTTNIDLSYLSTLEELQTAEKRDKFKSHARASDYDSVDFIIDDAVESNDKNDILSNIDIGDGSAPESDTTKATKIHSQNEPFFEASSWSECSGAPCGQLGKRFRKLSCRLYLSRSSKFAELPESSCQNAFAPDIQEPCYIDCPPESTSNNKSSSNLVYNDETVFDAEVTRFVWRKDGWTKCSAECLGGQRESIVECWDKVIESNVDPTFCDQELKLQADVETCNVSPCQPEWRVEEFTKCTRSCGSAGIKARTIACVQQVPIKDGSSYMVVSNDLCIQTNGSMPDKIEPCNRIHCRPEWSVGPWSECSKKCGDGIKNRTIICVQEFANKDGTNMDSSIHKHAYKKPGLDILEALAVSAKDWHPGKVTQVPFHECYEEYKTVPALEEKCFNSCENEPYIDSEQHQNYRMNHEALKRRTITLRVGGKAEVPEGRNLKIRCRIMNRQVRDNLVKRVSEQVEWRKDGIIIFSNGSTMADKQYIQDDNSIFGNDVLGDEKNQFMADDPNTKRSTKLTSTPRVNRSRQRNLIVRSWNNYHLGSQQLRSHGSVYNFVPQIGGRFSLVKENTLRIKRLRSDDSGLYACSYGSLSESLELRVVSRREPPMDVAEEKQLGNNLGL